MLPKNYQALNRRTRSLSILCEEDGGASRLTLTVLGLWMRLGFNKIKIRNFTIDEELGSNKDVIEFSAALAGLEFFDAAFWLSCSYAIWVGKTVQKNRAMFFTPPLLAEYLIDSLLKNGASLENQKWLDPACGGAAFIAPLASRMKQFLKNNGNSPSEILEKISKSIVGFDIDKTLCVLSENFLRMVLYEELCELGWDYEFQISQFDALLKLTNSSQIFDVIICNPPYRKLVKSDLNIYSEEYFNTIEGQHNLYGLFMVASLKNLKNNGLAGLLTPTSYLSGKHFSKLRKFIGQSSCVLQLDLVSNREGVFVGVEQETAIAIIKNESKQNGDPRLSRINRYEHDCGFQAIGSCVLSESGSAWKIPRTLHDIDLFGEDGNLFFSLSDYGYLVKVGPLVWNRDRRKKLLSEDDIANAERPVPVIWSSDIMPNGNFDFGKSSSNKRHFKFIDAGKDSIGKEYKIGLVSDSCLVMQRVTSPDQKRRLVSAVITSDWSDQYGSYIAENHVLTILPTSSSPAFTPNEMSELFGSDAVDKMFRCISGTVGVSIFELEQLPLPDPKIVRDIVNGGMTISDAVQVAYKSTKNLINILLG